MTKFPEKFHPIIEDELDPLLGLLGRDANERKKLQIFRCALLIGLTAVSLMIFLGLALIIYGQHYIDNENSSVNLTQSIPNDITVNDFIPGHNWSSSILTKNGSNGV